MTKKISVSAWEVAVMGGAVAGDGVPRVVIAVDGSGSPVLVAPVDRQSEVVGLLIDAARGRAPEVLRGTADAREVLRAVAKALGCRVELVRSLPSLEAAIRMMAQAAPGSSVEDAIPREATDWKPVFAALMKAQPWNLLPDSVTFRFSGGDGSLDEAVGVVLGLAGEVLGVSLFPTKRDFDGFQAVIRGGGAPNASWRAFAAHLDDVNDLPPPITRALRAHGLVSGGRALQVFGAEPRSTDRLNLRDERRLLAATQGILAAWRAHGGELAFQAAVTPAATVLGPLRVASSPRIEAIKAAIVQVSEGPLLLDAPMQVALAVNAPVVRLKLSQRDVRALIRLLDGVDVVRVVSQGAAGCAFVAYRGTTRVGVAFRTEDSEGAQRLRGPGAIVFAGGGASRRAFRAEDDILERPVLWLDAHEPNPWEGPPTGWPKVSEALRAFAEPLGIDARELESAKLGYGFAALVWSAVVSADVLGDPTHLASLRARVSGAGPQAAGLERLIVRKRTLFGHDTRMMVLESVRHEDDQLFLKVLWSPS